MGNLAAGLRYYTLDFISQDRKVVMNEEGRPMNERLADLLQYASWDHGRPSSSGSKPETVPYLLFGEGSTRSYAMNRSEEEMGAMTCMLARLKDSLNMHLIGETKSKSYTGLLIRPREKSV